MPYPDSSAAPELPEVAIEAAARAEAERRSRDEFWCGDPAVFAAGAKWAAAIIRGGDA